MDIGKLRHRIDIQQPVTVQDSYGQAVITWATVDTVWGSVDELSGRELLVSKQVASNVTTRITIRHYQGLNTQYRIVYGGNVYNIESVIEDAKKSKMEIMAKKHGVA